MPIERAMQYAHGSYAKLFSCVSGESLYKGVTETLIKRTAKMTCYEYFYESDYGMESGFVEATNRRELLAKMKAQFPDDIGSDGFAVDPDGNDFPLNW